MQLKRLEDMLGLPLLDRSGRTIALTASGEQVLAYARRMVALNDEVITKLTDQAFEGVITLGVPHDVVYPAVPQVLKQFHAAFPRVKVQLEASYTRRLKEQFAKGERDVIVTTEAGVDQGGEVLAVKPLVWVGAPGGTAWRQRPLQLAFCRYCVFRAQIVEDLDADGMAWEMSVDTDSDRAIEAAVSADLAVHAMIEGTQPPYLEVVDHGGALPALRVQQINLYGAQDGKDQVRDHLVHLLRTAFSGAPLARLKAG
jgi:DNA-binding transcriptional LysR family regulator